MPNYSKMTKPYFYSSSFLIIIPLLGILVKIILGVEFKYIYLEIIFLLLILIISIIVFTIGYFIKAKLVQTAIVASFFAYLLAALYGTDAINAVTSLSGDKYSTIGFSLGDDLFREEGAFFKANFLYILLLACCIIEFIVFVIYNRILSGKFVKITNSFGKNIYKEFDTENNQRIRYTYKSNIHKPNIYNLSIYSIILIFIINFSTIIMKFVLGEDSTIEFLIIIFYLLFIIANFLRIRRVVDNYVIALIYALCHTVPFAILVGVIAIVASMDFDFWIYVFPHVLIVSLASITVLSVLIKKLLKKKSSK